VNALRLWWQREGAARHPGARRACQIFCVSFGSRCPFVTYFG
jgi:hypothetical protein